MSCIVLPSLKLRMIVASVARLFGEVICSLSLRSICLVGVVPDLGFVPVFPPEYSTSVACGR